MTLTPGQPATVDLRVGQPVRKDESKDLEPAVQLRLLVPEIENAGDLSVRLNGRPLTAGAESGGWLEFSVNPALLTKGTNRFEFLLKPESAAKPKVEDLLLWVRYRTST